ncbi:trypsin-like cysteine/serine peptidase domain-containing protein [Phycomyces nitens]|nr:trypsin-like cysteine/serine peptidase domain-containing protein [Phycomyces nitens]
MALVLFFFYLRCSAVLAMANGISVLESTEYPFSVMITKPVMCGGALISLNPPWILTAAHCISNFTSGLPDRTVNAVAYGSPNTSNIKYASILKAVPHPRYNTQLDPNALPSQDDRDSHTMHYDIGLVQLTRPILAGPNVDRIALWGSTEPDPNWESSLLTIGMGYIGLDKPQAKTLQKANCDIVANAITKTYSTSIQENVYLTTSQASLCHGDSGSPLIGTNEKDPGRFFLVGVLNRILNAHDPNPSRATCPVPNGDPAVVYNVFAKGVVHLEWIMNVTQLSVADLTQHKPVGSYSLTLSSGSHPLLLSPLSSLLVISLVIWAL